MDIIKNNKIGYFIIFVLYSISINAECKQINNNMYENAFSVSVIDYGQIIYGTLIVLMILGGTVFLFKKLRINNIGQNGLVDIISSYHITTKDKLLLIRVSKEYLLLGVSNGGINKIHTLATEDIENLTNSLKPGSHSFSKIYAATIGKLHND